jgi:flagellar motor switch protein FliM
VVVVISFEVELENSIGSMLIALPYATIEPIRSKLYAAFQSERLEVDHAWISRFRGRLLETPVSLNVTLGECELSGRQLLNMSVGDIILLNSDEDALLKAEVQGVLKFYGRPGFVKGNKAFQIVKEEETHF